MFITAGEFDPWRTPSPSLWLDDLQKMKADGYNAVTVYFDWDYTSPSPGVYDFGGVRDMNEFLNMAQQAGLYVIARPGPYINAETDGGGIPSWVLTSPNGYRSDTQPYLSAALQWFSQIDSIIAPHQITNGGDVILYQIENEYTGTSAGGPAVHGRPGAAGHLGRDRRAVHVQPVLRRGHVLHLGHRRGEHQRAGQLPARLQLRQHQQLRPAVRLPEPSRRAALPARVPGRLVRRLGRLGLRQLLLP